MRRFTATFPVAALSLAALSLAVVAGACGGSKGASSTTTTSSTIATTSTTTAASGSPTSTDKVAVFLDGTIVTPAELKAALGLKAEPVAYPGTADAPAPPQGPLSLAGVVQVFPSPAYEALLAQGGASVGANRTYLVTEGGPYVLDVLAVKFKNGDLGKLFVSSSTSTAVSFGQAQQTSHPELKAGILPGIVLRVPPNPPSTTERVVSGALYQDGVYYLVSGGGPAGKVADDVVIKVVQAQDSKYQGKKSSLPA
jgi:hypothetical protein